LCGEAVFAGLPGGFLAQEDQQMSTITMGSTARVHYKGTLADGSVFDSSFERDPLEVKVGAGGFIEGFINALLGMSVGETKQVTIVAEEAYGERIDQLIQEVGREQMPPEIELQVGLMLESIGDDGQRLRCLVTEVTDDKVVLDYNHPLAGQDLTFHLEVVEIA
jgi:peptidylprolyl isomerase